MSETGDAKYRGRLPMLDGGRFLTDGGLETCLIFHEGWELPIGEAFTLMETERGRNALRAYFDRYIPMAVTHDVGFILESPTWRANPDWGAKAGYGPDRLAELNRASIALMQEIRAKYEAPKTPIVISGCVGPRGDGYDPGTLMSPGEAEAYHAWQVDLFKDTACDCVTAMTLTNVAEAIGFARAARAAAMPCVISFTVETDGHLPTGQRLSDAIEAVDAEAGSWPAYYMINCAHPTHFADVLDRGADWVRRLRSLRANASRCSHAELDNAPELDTGDPHDLGQRYEALIARFPHINVLGGCCGTDHRHIEAIGQSCLGKEREVA